MILYLVKGMLQIEHKRFGNSYNLQCELSQFRDHFKHFYKHFCEAFPCTMTHHFLLGHLVLLTQLGGPLVALLDRDCDGLLLVHRLALLPLLGDVLTPHLPPGRLGDGLGAWHWDLLDTVSGGQTSVLQSHPDRHLLAHLLVDHAAPLGHPGAHLHVLLPAGPAHLCRRPGGEAAGASG